MYDYRPNWAPLSPVTITNNINHNDNNNDDDDDKAVNSYGDVDDDDEDGDDHDDDGDDDDDDFLEFFFTAVCLRFSQRIPTTECSPEWEFSFSTGVHDLDQLIRYR